MNDNIFIKVIIFFVHLFPVIYSQNASTYIYSCNRPGVVALTYDDGPSQFTPRLLQTLKSKGVNATFFVLGVAIIKNGPDALKAAYKGGHQIALHTNTHPHLDSLSKAAQITEMTNVQQVVYDSIGVIPFYMRPPYGECGSECKQTMRSLNYIVTLWNDDSNDWRVGSETGNKQPQTTLHFKNLYGPIAKANPKTDSFIILQHDTDETTVNLAPDIIDAIKEKGFTFDTVAGCIGNNTPPPYKKNNNDSIANYGNNVTNLSLNNTTNSNITNSSNNATDSNITNSSSIHTSFATRLINDYILAIAGISITLGFL
ncbi:10254_t:CDS:2 [Ambispora leptoticha]|uniref:10254_t:CDS:1 n=1 Tax=Ambispora leptoticha TaxID=144679 RepID=A0A9N9CYC3_9GLOM|nr:10254_t:CDS:2 [Ambispora leptoticha]